MRSTDEIVRRFERDAVVACAILAALAWIWPGGLKSAAAVVGGGLLAAVSYLGVRGVVGTVGSGEKPSRLALVKFFTRYAILAIVAYGMLARLRLSPVGVVAGASSLVVAATAAAVRALVSASRSGNPR
jgi:hypothetical protein